MDLRKIVTQSAPQALGPYSQAIIIPANRPLIFVSGQLPIDLQTQELLQGDIRAMTKLILESIEAILQAGNSNLQLVIRTDVFLTNLKRDFSAMNEEYALHFSPHTPPARQTIEVAGLPKGSPIEISCIALQ